MNFIAKVVVRPSSALELLKLAETLGWQSAPVPGTPMTKEREAELAERLYGAGTIEQHERVLADTQVITMRAELNGALEARAQAIENMHEMERELDRANDKILDQEMEIDKLRTARPAPRRKAAKR